MENTKTVSIKKQNKSAASSLMKKNIRKFMRNKLAVLGLVTIPFSLVVLRQRLREIEKGELNEARKY